MLRHLSIRDFALVREVDLSFAEGLTILVGETGAGKSIIIDALAAALGERTTIESIRSGARKAVLEASFSTEGLPEIQQLLAEQELSWESPELLVRREIATSGTTRCFVNDTPTTASVVRQLASYLMDFHGQHDTHGLLHVRRHREILDSSATYRSQLDEMKGAWGTLSEARRRCTELELMSAEADAVRERCEQVIRQVGTLDPRPQETDQLEADLRRAEDGEQILQSATTARLVLMESDTSAHAQLVIARDKLRELVPYAPSLTSLIDELEAALTTCKEAYGATAQLANVDEFNPEALEVLRRRLSSLQRLVRQYGSLEAAIQQRNDAQQELDELQHVDELLGTARQQEANALSHARKAAKVVHEHRQAAAVRLEEVLTTSLREMGMPNAIASVQVRSGELGEHGSDEVEFFLSANAGEAPRPLQKVGSGGELSRFMLALKTAVVQSTSLGTMVFDEIDTGISGRVARKVGEVMRSLSSRTQVICITHLAQIASLAHTMIRVTKDEQDDKTQVHALVVTTDDAIVEVARLLSGDHVTNVALQGARELMER